MCKRHAVLARLRRLDPALLALFAGLTAYYCATDGIFQGKASGDGMVNFLYLPSVFVHRTLDMSAAVREAGSWPMPIVNDSMPNPKAVGPSAAWAPFYVVGLGVEWIARRWGELAGKPFGVNRLAYWVCGFATLVYGLAGLALLFRLMRRRLGVGAARVGVVGAVLATPAVWYLVHQPAYPHGLSLFCGAWFVERWDAWRGRESTRRRLALGAIAGLGMLMRVQEALFLALPAADLLIELSSRRQVRQFVAGGAALAAGALAVFSLQLGIWWHDHGSLLSPQVTSGFMRWTTPSFTGTLFATRGGLFAWSPLCYLGLVGLVVAWRRLGALAAGLGALFLLDLYVNACAQDWWGSWGFGARRFCDVTVVFAVGLGGLWYALAARRAAQAALAVVVALAAAANLHMVELLRARKVPSSSTYAMAGAEWLHRAGAPPSVSALVRRIGWPPSWPGSLPFAFAHHVPVSTFEDVYGMYFLERIYKDHDWPTYATILGASSLVFDSDEAPRYQVRGFGPRAPGGVQVLSRADEPAHLLLPLFEKEAVRVALVGFFPVGDDVVRWNGAYPTTRRVGDQIVFELTRDQVRAGVNDLEMVLPPSSRISTILLQPQKRPKD
jgi:hypothetical protein